MSMTPTEAEMRSLLFVGAPEWARHAEARIAAGFDPPGVRPSGLTPEEATARRRAAKPRGSLADAVRAKRECIPCQAAAAVAAPAPRLADDAQRLLSTITPKPYESLEWLRRWAAQGADPLADVRRYTTPPADPGPQPVPVVGWLHIAILGSWEPILRELLSAIERSGLLAATSRVYAGVVGPEADLSWLPKWLIVVKRDGPLEMGENSTLAALWEWSKSAPPSKCWYAHTKGASHPGNANVTAWRDFLMYWNVLRWRDCVAALETHDACGTDYVVVDDNPWFVSLWGAVRLRPGSRGFPGNFAWARSDYLAAIPADLVRLDRDRWDAEWSYFGAGNPRVKVLHASRVNYYNEFYGRERYDAGRPPDPGVADCGDGVYLTDAASCDRVVRHYDLSVHVWKPADLGTSGVCGRSPDGPGIAVEYVEGDPLDTMRPGLPEVREYLARPGLVLIHCAAGQTRGAALAVVAKVARGRSASDAIGQVLTANREQRGVGPPIGTPLADLFETTTHSPEPTP